MSDEVQEQESLYDLSTQVGEDRMLVGYLAIVKTIDEEGQLHATFVAHNIERFETVGFLTAHLDKLRQDNVLDLYDPEEENEEG